jgi:hypothetical protein
MEKCKNYVSWPKSIAQAWDLSNDFLQNSEVDITNQEYKICS